MVNRTRLRLWCHERCALSIPSSERSCGGEFWFLCHFSRGYLVDCNRFVYADEGERDKSERERETAAKYVLL